MDTRCQNFGFADARYKYTEKERDAETGYDYFGARYYDARVGRWMSVDPLAQRYFAWSPYCFSKDDPFLFVDRDGRGVKKFVEELGKAVSGKVSFGLQGGFEFSGGKRHVGAHLNLLSTTVVGKEKNDNFKILPGEWSSGAGLVIQGLGASAERTLSPTKTTIRQQGVYTDVVSTNSMTSEATLGYGFGEVSRSTIETRTQHLGSNTVQTTTKESDASLTPLDLIQAKASTIVGVDLKVSLTGMAKAIKSLFE